MRRSTSFAATVSLGVALLLITLVTPICAPAATPALAPGAKVERLKFAVTPPWNETLLPWMGGSWTSNLVTRIYAEPLIETDHRTGELIPGLATSWEMTTPDAKTWTFRLRKGVPFHFGWGDFTAKDVVHTIARIIDEGSIATDASPFRALFGKTEDEVRQHVLTPDDYTVVFKLLRPEPNLEFITSAQAGNLLILSKAQWDKEGFAGVDKKPAGTGSWRVAQRQLGQWILFERVENHWRKTPEFKEFQLFTVPEVATRMAMLLAGEVHISELDRTLFKEVTAKGMQVVNSVLPAVQWAYLMGGVYRPDTPQYDPTVPYTNVKVREAINRAINRKDLLENLLQGYGEPLYVMGYHPKLPGWNREWEQQFERNYGYDPVRAKRLLAEAGYPEGFKTKVMIAPISGFPELTTAAEALVSYLQAIGVQVESEEIEFARLREIYRTQRAHNMIWAQKTSLSHPITVSRWYDISPPRGGTVYSHLDARKDERYAQIVNSPDKADQARLLREIGDIKFQEYAQAPIAWLPGQLVVNPKVVGEYVFPGNVDAAYTHIEYVKPAR